MRSVSQHSGRERAQPTINRCTQCERNSQVPNASSGEHQRVVLLRDARHCLCLVIFVAAKPFAMALVTASSDRLPVPGGAWRLTAGIC